MRSALYVVQPYIVAVIPPPDFPPAVCSRPQGRPHHHTGEQAAGGCRVQVCLISLGHVVGGIAASRLRAPASQVVAWVLDAQPGQEIRALAWVWSAEPFLAWMAGHNAPARHTLQAAYITCLWAAPPPCTNPLLAGICLG